MDGGGLESFHRELRGVRDPFGGPVPTVPATLPGMVRRVARVPRRTRGSGSPSRGRTTSRLWLRGRFEDLSESVQVLLHALLEKAFGQAAEVDGGTGQPFPADLTVQY